MDGEQKKQLLFLIIQFMGLSVALYYLYKSMPKILFKLLIASMVLITVFAFYMALYKPNWLDALTVWI